MRLPRRSSATSRRIAVAVGTSLLAAGVLVAIVARHRAEFEEAVGAAPLTVLVVATVLQIVALVARTEAWHVCVCAAGGTLARRRLFRAAGVGYLGSQLNSQVGAAARIAALRRTDPGATPRISALVTAEVPILVTEGALAAIASFTLVGPLGLPWWSPLVCLALAAATGAGLGALSHRRRHGLWSGLAVLRSMGGRVAVVLLILVAVFAQIARNWIMLRTVGVDASVFDATAVLIAMVLLSQLPIGPSVGAGAVVLILGSGGVAAAAAAGVLLTATGVAGALAYTAWAALDTALARRRRPLPAPVAPIAPVVVPPAAGLPSGR